MIYEAISVCCIIIAIVMISPLLGTGLQRRAWRGGGQAERSLARQFESHDSTCLKILEIIALFLTSPIIPDYHSNNNAHYGCDNIYRNIDCRIWRNRPNSTSKQPEASHHP